MSGWLFAAIFCCVFILTVAGMALGLWLHDYERRD